VQFRTLLYYPRRALREARRVLACCTVVPPRPAADESSSHFTSSFSFCRILPYKHRRGYYRDYHFVTFRV